MIRAFSETINVAAPIPVASGLIDFENKVQQVIVQMKELGYEPTIMQVRDFVRVGQFGDLTEFIKQLEQEEEITNAPFSEKISTGDEFKESEWEILKKKIATWKKTGGVLEAKMKGKPNGITDIQKKAMVENIAENLNKTTQQVNNAIAQVIDKTKSSIEDIYNAWQKSKTSSSFTKIERKAIRGLNLQGLKLQRLKPESLDLSTLMSPLEVIKTKTILEGGDPSGYKAPETLAPRVLIITELLSWKFSPEEIVKELISNPESGWEETDIRNILGFLKKFKIETNDEFKEIELTMGSKQWQKLRDEIKRWKKSGGILKAKLKGKKGKEITKRIEELVAQRGAKLTSEEMDEIAATPGIVPPWWSKDTGYDKGAIKAIKKLGVSALDVHIAVERDYTGKPLSKIQREILKVGWE